jgi:hypothetical protein
MFDARDTTNGDPSRTDHHRATLGGDHSSEEHPAVSTYSDVTTQYGGRCHVGRFIDLRPGVPMGDENGPTSDRVQVVLTHGLD